MSEIDRHNAGAREGEPPTSVRRVSDEDIARAARSLLAAAPSPRLRAEVMARLNEGPRAGFVPVRQWRLAFAMAAMLILAVAVWFGVRPSRGPSGTAAQRTDAPTANHPSARTDRPTPQTSPVPTLAQGVPPATSTPRTAGRRTPVTSRRNVWPEGDVGTARLASAPVPLSLVASLSAGETRDVAPVGVLSDIDPLDVPRLLDPEPVAIAPVVLKPLDIPQITIAPVPDPADKAQPPGSGQAGKRPGAEALPKM